MLYNLRYFRLFLLIFFRKIKQIFGLVFNKFLLCLGITYAEFSDCFFFASISLLLFRLFFRLFFFINPYWYFNLGIYILSAFYQFHSSPLNRIRVFVIKTLKILLGKTYWYSYTLEEIYAFKALGITSRFPTINISEGSICNKIFRLIFIFLIWFRLFLLKVPYKALGVTFLFNLFLIFNQFFLISSFLSILFLFSKLSFFATDFNVNDFYKIITAIEKFNKNQEFIVPSWENAVILSFLAVRSFCLYEISQVMINKKFYNVSGKEYYGMNDFYARLIQYRPMFYKYSLHVTLKSLCVKVQVRKICDYTFFSSNGLEGYPYKRILVIKRKKKQTFFKFSGGIPLVVAETVKDKNKPIMGFLKNDLIGFKFIFSDPASPKGEWFSKFFFKIPAVIEHHPVVGFYVKDKLIGAFNKSTVKLKSENTYLSKHIEEGTGRSSVRCAKVQLIEENKKHKLDALINTLHEQKQIVPVPTTEDFFLHFSACNYPKFVTPESALFVLFQEFEASTYVNLILPDAVNCMFLYLNPLTTKAQAIDGLETAINYFSIMVKKPLPPIQLTMYLEIMNVLKNCLNELAAIPQEEFHTIEYPYVEYKTNVLKKINASLEFSNEPPFVSIQETLVSVFPHIEYVGTKHINNIDKLAKKQGGKEKRQFAYKHLTEEKIQHQNTNEISLTDIKNVNSKLFVPKSHCNEENEWD